MKKVSRVKYMGVLMGALFLAGCGKAPEQDLIKQKGGDSVEKYEEVSESGETVGETVRTRIGAPEKYENSTADSTGMVHIQTNASVEVPEVEKVPTVSVSQHPFDEEFIDQLTEALLPGAKIYLSKEYQQKTKAEWQEQIEVLKGYVAEGNLDPYHRGTDEQGNYVYDIYGAIETAQQKYAEAPEEKSIEEVEPQFGLPVDIEQMNRVNSWELTSEDQLGNTRLFNGVACMEDGTVYDYLLTAYSSMPMEVIMRKQYDEADQNIYRVWESQTLRFGVNGPGTQELEEKVGITLDEAKTIADETVKKLPVSGLEMSSWEYGILWPVTGETYTEGSQYDAGYILHYTRNYQGIPVTYTSDRGGFLESGESDAETWAYENLTVVVSASGIEEIHINNLYDTGEEKNENVKLLPFDEIMKIYEKMMTVQNAGMEDMKQIYQIDRITLGYSRIYEPSGDTYTGLLVPVWHFFGTSETVEQSEEAQSWRETEKYKSYLAVNAVDGSIIDNTLGY